MGKMLFWATGEFFWGKVTITDWKQGRVAPSGACLNQGHLLKPNRELAIMTLILIFGDETKLI